MLITVSDTIPQGVGTFSFGTHGYSPPPSPSSVFCLIKYKRPNNLKNRISSKSINFITNKNKL